MKKKNNKGFVLMETLIVSTVVIGIITFVYLQFGKLRNSYSDSFKYNSIPGLYSVKSIVNYVINKEGNINSIAKSVVDNTKVNYLNDSYFINITSQDLDKLKEVLEIKDIYVLQDYTFEKEKVSRSDADLYSFLSKLSYSSDANSYHMVVIFSDGTLSSFEFSAEGGDVDEG